MSGAAARTGREIKKRKKKIYRKRSRGQWLTSKKIVTQENKTIG